MSRARQHTTVHVVADDVDQAVEDLQRDWAHEHRPRWAIDTGTPETNALRAERSPDVPVDLRDQSATSPPDSRTPRRPVTCPHPKPLPRRPSSGVACDRPTDELAAPRTGHRTLRRPRAHRRRPHPQRRPESPCPRRADRHRPRPQPAGPPPLGTGSRSQPSRRTRRHQRLDRPRRTPPPAPHRPDPPARGEPSDRCPPNPAATGSPNSTRASNNSSEQSSGRPAATPLSCSISGGPYPTRSDRSTPRTSASSCRQSVPQTTSRSPAGVSGHRDLPAGGDQLPTRSHHDERSVPIEGGETSRVR